MVAEEVANQRPGINAEVYVTDMKDDIGKGIVQGYHLVTVAKVEVRKPLVRFYMDQLTKKGERYLKSKMCLTVQAKHSRLYVMDNEELTVRHNGSKRKVSESSE